MRRSQCVKSYGGNHEWLVCSVRSQSAPVGVRTVSVIKPTFGSATKVGPNSSYARYG